MSDFAPDKVSLSQPDNDTASSDCSEDWEITWQDILHNSSVGKDKEF